MQNTSIAVIDIGSNSVRFMLYNSQIAVNNKQVNSTVLGEGLALTGSLNNDAILRTANAVNEFVCLAKNVGASEIFIFATEAVRAAKNGNIFTDLVFSKTGIAVDVISGTIEAQIGFTSISSNCKGAATAIDIGGASVEITSGTNGKVAYSKSLPLGLVRLLDLVGNDRQNLHKYIKQNLVNFGEVPRCKNIVAIGGTATSVASMNLAQSIYNPLQVHNSTVTLQQLTELEAQVFASKSIMQDFPTIKEARAKIIGHGIIMLIELLEYLNADNIKVSELDNMEGYLIYKNRIQF